MDFKKEVFRVLPTNEKNDDFIIIVGEHLATEKHFKTKEDAYLYLDTPKWDTILALVGEMLNIKDKK